MKKKILSIFAVLLAAVLAAGCVPTEHTTIGVDPDFEGKANAQLDFIQLNNDSIDRIDDKEPYSYVASLSIDGDDGTKTITVLVGCIAETLEEDSRAFTAAILKSIAASAASQAIEYVEPGADDFGTFWDAYNAEVKFVLNDDFEKAGAVPFYTYEHKAGEKIDLDPDIQGYVDEYYRQKAIFEKSLDNEQ